MKRSAEYWSLTWRLLVFLIGTYLIFTLIPWLSTL